MVTDLYSFPGEERARSDSISRALPAEFQFADVDLSDESNADYRANLHLAPVRS